MRRTVNVADSEKVRKFKTRLADKIGDSRFRTWFGDVSTIELADDAVQITAPSKFVADWIATNFEREITAVAEEFMRQRCQISIRVLEQPIARPAPVSPRRKKPRAARSAAFADTRRPLSGTFDSFVVGPANELAFAAAYAALRDSTNAYRPLIIHGACGLGKTHLLQAICNSVNVNHPTMSWLYVSGEEFTNQFVDSLKTNKEAQFRARYREVDILVVDDIHFLENKTATQSEFLHTFNALDSVGRSVILSSDRHPRKLADHVNAQLLDRLHNGMVVEIQPPTFETRCEILRKFAQSRQARVTDDVVELISRHVDVNVRALERVFNSVIAHAQLSKRAIDVSLVRKILELDGLLDSGPVTHESILRAVSAVLGISANALSSNARDRCVSGARSLAMSLCRNRLGMDFATIGKQFGNKHHSTVLVACRRVDKLIRENGEIMQICQGVPQSMPICRALEQIDVHLQQGAA